MASHLALRCLGYLSPNAEQKGPELRHGNTADRDPCPDLASEGAGGIPNASSVSRNLVNLGTPTAMFRFQK